LGLVLGSGSRIAVRDIKRKLQEKEERYVFYAARTSSPRRRYKTD